MTVSKGKLKIIFSTSFLKVFNRGKDRNLNKNYIHIQSTRSKGTKLVGNTLLLFTEDQRELLSKEKKKELTIHQHVDPN